MSSRPMITRRVALLGPTAAAIAAPDLLLAANVSAAFDAALAEYRQADRWMRKRNFHTDESMDAAIDACGEAALALLKAPAKTAAHAVALLEIGYGRLFESVAVDAPPLEHLQISDLEHGYSDDADRAFIEAAIRALRPGRA